MFRKIKAIDILLYIAAVTGVAIGTSPMTVLDVVFFVLLALVIAIILARIIQIEFAYSEILYKIIHSILQIMAIACVYELMYRSNYIVDFFLAVILWCCITYARLSVTNRREEEERRANTWKYYEYRRATGRTTSNRTSTAEQTSAESAVPTPFLKSKYYKNCTNEEELKDKYRDLVKRYHPDNRNGDEEIFVQINNEYEELLEYLEGNDGKTAKERA